MDDCFAPYNFSKIKKKIFSNEITRSITDIYSKRIQDIIKQTQGYRMRMSNKIHVIYRIRPTFRCFVIVFWPGGRLEET